MDQKEYEILVDTGGTFTDCIAFLPDQTVKKIKVLSNSSLRGKLVKKNDDHSFTSSDNWNISTDLFAGYSIKFLNTSFASDVSAFDPDNCIFKIQDPLPDYIHKNAEFEITAFEEAPILCVRLITGIRLDEELPPVKMKLGTTKGTNALLERKGSKVTFIVTKGFKDLITIGSQQRPDLFTLNVIKHQPLYNDVIEIDERIDSCGNVLCPLSTESMDTLIHHLKKKKAESIAIALLNSYKNDTHEIILKNLLIHNGFSFVSISSQMAREIKILPRAQTAIINAYLEKTLFNYLKGIQLKINIPFKVMTSYGGLMDSSLFLPKDSLLSGPAGGIVGAFDIGKSMGEEKLITFDMGGTSTDVSRIDNKFDYQFETDIDDIHIFTPVLSIETVAAGGGSICGFDGFKMTVGPDSAGASPGPACYGAGGPFALTDVNLLLGRLDYDSFGIPINKNAAEKALQYIIQKMAGTFDKEEILIGFLRIANEKMADAIRKISLRKGHNTSQFTLLAFGGAGGQNACALADLLSIKKIIVPFDAGLLSAYGIGKANIERFAQKQLLKPLDELRKLLRQEFENLKLEAMEQLIKEGFQKKQCQISQQLVYMRFKGQETCVEIPYINSTLLQRSFKEQYESLYGHWIEKEMIEIESIKIVLRGMSSTPKAVKIKRDVKKHGPKKYQKIFSNGKWLNSPVYQWEELSEGCQIAGPALLVSNNSTVFIDSAWVLDIKQGKNAMMTNLTDTKTVDEKSNELAELELFTNRFMSIAEDMGAILQHSSFSVNIKERLDFSCGVLDQNGFLVANAPHIPVHLGSLGICVRSVIEKLPLHPGDVIITNHPGFGGSHLPDITLISGAFTPKGELIGYVANRAHHAEIGGKTPGSMPPDATSLLEEGVIISPTYLIKKGKGNWEEVRKLLLQGPYPTRSIDENIADLNGALASVKNGVQGLEALVKKFSLSSVHYFMERLQEYSASCVDRSFTNLRGNHWQAKEKLDDGTEICVDIKRSGKEVTFDFSGSSQQHGGNLNATKAILTSTIIYVLKLMVTESIPLNEGIIRQIKIEAPLGSFLNPIFPEKFEDCPAVVGGNTETSQRIVDALIKALGLAACSQGTMNNFIFGNDQFGFYETICGGTGAGNGFDGVDAVHQHMTNTKITDPEIIEYRYPVRLERMEIRPNSGGKGKWKGGNGVVREITFLDEIDISMVTQHRSEAPYGMHGGKPGKKGTQYIITKEGAKIKLSGIDGKKVKKGDKIIIKTPGGGGWGTE